VDGTIELIVDDPEFCLVVDEVPLGLVVDGASLWLDPLL